ncbi:MAG: DNA cytosine methyltransferase, partial [Desulfuromonadales bacterium]|nr:DNA cytosine methyltransferase [Desulfuromonadales bacterium]
FLPPATVARFGEGFRLLDPADPTAYATCFTAGYGRSLMHAGAYISCGERVRHFSPTEIALLLGFPPTFRFPPEIPRRKQWHLLGNSLSVTAVREVLRDGFGGSTTPTASSISREGAKNSKRI